MTAVFIDPGSFSSGILTGSTVLRDPAGHPADHEVAPDRVEAKRLVRAVLASVAEARRLGQPAHRALEHIEDGGRGVGCMIVEECGDVLEVGGRLIGELAHHRRTGRIDLDGLEFDLRDAMHGLGARVLGGLLAADGRGHHGPRHPCPRGHPTEFHDYRPKTVTTVLGPVPFERAYDFCQDCHEGFFAEHLFVGSGVVGAGCRTVIGQRLKRSGMRWTVRGSSAILALRCCLLSARWEETWARRLSG